METIGRVIESVSWRSIRNFQFDSLDVIAKTGLIKSERYVRIETEIANQMLQRGKMKVSCVGLILSQDDAGRQKIKWSPECKMHATAEHRAKFKTEFDGSLFEALGIERISSGKRFSIGSATFHGRRI